VTTYEYRCDRDGVFDALFPLGTAPETVTCNTCGAPARRVFSRPMVRSSRRDLVAMIEHAEKTRTDPDVEDAIRAGDDPSAVRFLGWTSQQGEECGDFPVFEANPLSQVFQEVPLTNGNGTVPVQFQYSNAVEGPEGPTPNPERLSQAAGGKP